MRRISYEGKIYQFPDGMSDEEVDAAMRTVTGTGPSRLDAAKAQNEANAKLIKEKEGNQAGFFSNFYDNTIGPIVEMGKQAHQQQQIARQEIANTPGLLGKAGTALRQGAEALPQVQAAKMAGGILADSGSRLGEAGEHLGRGEVGQAVGRAASAVPILGPAVDEVTDTAILDRNPVGAAGQAAGIAASILGPKIAPKAAAAVRTPIRKAAAHNMVQALDPKTIAGKKAALKVAPKMVDDGVVAASPASLATKAGAKVQELGGQIDDFYRNLPDDTSVRVGPILKRMKEKGVDDFIVKGLAGDAKVAASKQARRAIAEMQDLRKRIAAVSHYDPKKGQNFIPVKALRQFRQQWDEVAARAHRYDGTGNIADTSTAQTQGLAADAARDAINTSFPQIRQLNKEFRHWKEAFDVADSTATRHTAQNHIVRHGFGGVLGHHLAPMVGVDPWTGAALGVAGASALRNAGVRTGLAQGLRGANAALPQAGLLGPASLAAKEQQRQGLL